MSVSLKPSNGVGYNYSYTVTAADASAGYVIFNFNTKNTIVVNFEVLTSANAEVAIAGAVKTYPAAGQVKIASGGGYTVTAGTIIEVIAGIKCELAGTSNLV